MIIKNILSIDICFKYKWIMIIGIFLLINCVNAAPLALWTQNKSSGPAPLDVQFVDLSSSTITGWNWSFGDGSLSTTQSPSHTYSNPGIYNVSLNVTNASGTNITKWYRDIIVGGTTNSNTNTYDKKLYLTFNGTGGSKLAYDSSKTNNTVFFTTGTATSPNPLADINTTQSKFGGASARFYSTGAAMVPWNHTLDLGGNDFYIGWWENDTQRAAGTVSATNHRVNMSSAQYSWMITYANSGAVTNAYASNTSTSWDLVSGATMGETVCATWTYYAFTRNGSSWQAWKNGVIQSVSTSSGVIWDNNTAIILGGYHPSPGSWDTSIYNGFIDDFVIYNGRSINGSIVPTRELISNPDAEFSASNFTGFGPSLKVNFYDATLGDAINGWNWTFGGANFSNSQNPTYTFSGVGNYSVKLNVSGVFGNDTITKYVLVNPPLPAPNFTSNNTYGYSPFTVNFTDTSTSDSTITGWSWLFGDENWTKVPFINMTASPGWIVRFGHATVAMPDGSVVIMGGASDGGIYLNDVWRSTDNGATWTQMTPNAGWGTRVWYTTHAATSTSDGSVILAGGGNASGVNNETWISGDKGATWTLMNASSGWEARTAFQMVTMPDNSIILTGGATGVLMKNDTWRSTDKGRTWVQMNASSGWGTRQSMGLVSLSDGSVVLTGGTLDGTTDYNDTWRSTDNGAKWTRINASSGWSVREYHTSVTMPDDSILLMGGSNATMSGGQSNDTWRSTDKGYTWTLVNASSGWSARRAHGTVAMSDGSVLIIGGLSPTSNATWRYNPINSTGQNPTHVYSSAGLYNVSLQVYTAFGTNSTRKIAYENVTTLIAPVSTFTANTTDGYNPSWAGYNPRVVTFNDTSINFPSTWRWNATNVTGNNTPFTFSTSQNITQQFGVGNFRIQFNTTNTVGFNVSPKNFWVNVSDPFTMSVMTNTTVIYNATGNSTWTAPLNVTSIEYLIVAGGGGAGIYAPGGGGAGGLLYCATYPVKPGGVYNLTIGEGGRNGYFQGPLIGESGLKGRNSSFSNLTININSTGGGGGASDGDSSNATPASTGGSGGGGIYRVYTTGAAGTSGQGNAGGNSSSAPDYIGGGGGGAGSAGFNGGASNGTGGAGLAYNLTGTNTIFSTGGNGTGNIGGLYNATICINTNYGGGGCKNAMNDSYANDGIIIIRYASAPTASFNANITTGANPLPVQFNDTSTNLPTAWQWNATNVTGNNTPFTFNTSQNPYQLFNVGNFSIKLNASNSGGWGVSTQNTWINVSQTSPVANFTSNITSGWGYNPTIIAFNDTSTNSPTAWQWNATNVTGNNTPFTFSTSQNITQQFGIGNFRIQLSAGNLGGWNISTKNFWANISDPYTITVDSNITVIYNVTGNTTWTAPSGVTSIEYLIVGGGGGGGDRHGGGGGAGGMLNGSTTNITPGNNYTISVGSGGIGASGEAAGCHYGSNGSISTFNNITALGGGAGGAGDTCNGLAGGSGGGATGRFAGTGGAGTSGQGNKGGNTSGLANWYCGGGGGAGTRALDVGSNTNGNGGIGLPSNITGIVTYYAGGGGGANNITASDGGAGGGGTGGGMSAGAGTDGLGGGGGGAQYTLGPGGKGGSGIVIIRYSLPPVASFTANLTAGTNPLPVQFNDTSTNLPTAWQWNATNVTGNNTPFNFSTSQNPIQTFNVGNFSIKLNASNSGGWNISTQNTWINVSQTVPVSNFTTNVTTGEGYNPTIIAFNDTSTNSPTAWQWNATNVTGNNTPFTFNINQNITQQFGIGNFKIQLSAQNAGGWNTSTQNFWANISDPYTTTVNTNITVVFNITGNTTWTAPTGVTSVEYLIVGGGGSGGYMYGGGGGGGGFCTTAAYAVTPGNNYTIVVGTGGNSVGGGGSSNGLKGSNSSFNTIIAYGGGAGWTAGGSGAQPPLVANGSSGGGGGVPPTSYTVLGGYGIAGQGYNGGTGNRLAAGGGGGAGQIGENSQTDGADYGGDGGNGLTSNITGTLTTYAGGGGGCGWSGIGTGGSGGGGDGNLIGSGTPTSGTDKLGGGGGGATGVGSIPSGKGGSGIIVLRYSLPPTASFTANLTTGANPFPVQFNDTSTNLPTAWQWNATNVTGNNTPFTFSTSQNPTQIFNVGNFSIRLNASNSGGWNVSSQNTWINVSLALPIPNFTANNTFGLQDLPVQFTSDSVTSITAYNWTFGDGNFSTSANPLKIYSVPGIYSVKLNVTNISGYNETTYTNYIEVRERILPVSDFTANITLGIQNVPVQFTDNSLSAIDSWNWTFGDGNTSTAQNPLFTYSVPGTYSVDLNVTNTSGFDNLTKSNYIKITARVPPIPNFTTDVTNGLIPLTVHFTDDSQTSITAWNWSFGDGNFSNLQNPSYIYSSYGSYTIILTVENASATNSTTRTNYIDAIYLDAAYAADPTKALSTPANIGFYDTSIGSGHTWLWNFGDGYTSSSANPLHTYSAPGLYTIQLTITSNSSGLSDTVVCTQCMNIQNVTYTSGGYPAFNYTDPGTIDIVNSSGLDSWMYYMMVTNKSGPWQFPVVGFATGIMQPFVNGFEGVAGSGNGNIVYLILWGLFIMMVWRNSGKITIPALIGCITAGAWSLLFPESAQPWVSILIAAALASQLLTFFAKE